MRITGGALGSRRLHVPRSADIRPMRDQVRAALFNILMDVVEDSVFLDLFAGTGSVGLEALSRGAAEAVFVDQGREALELLQRNVAELAVGDRAHILAEDVFRALTQLSEADRRFDLVFVGPPYGAELAHQTLIQVADEDVLGPEAVVVTEIFKKESVNAEYGLLTRIDERLYGDNRLVFYRRT
ncbi:MAG: 16S rRNA (guanine(966)-N(2))-methyltransferase RsmD [Candidatus Bipolaricaulia bacterium]